MGQLRVLVVGAGAVGQVYAHHFQRGGAAVTMFVRAKYQAEAAAGFTLYRLRRRKVEAQRFEGFAVATTAAEVAAARFDQIVLTVATPALRGPWLAELIAAAGDATIVSLQPGLDARALVLAAGVDEARLVRGLISLISYHAPLPGETRFPTPGMAYWFPPLAPCPFAGPRDRTAAVVAALRAGGFPAKVAKDTSAAEAFPSAVMMPYLAALELGGWTVRGAVQRGTLAEGAAAARQAIAVVRHVLGRPPLGVRLLARPRVLRTGLWFARPLIPIPLEVYLEAHFTKVGDQTAEMLDAYVAKGRAAGLPVDALEALAARLAAQRGAPKTGSPSTGSSTGGG